MSSSPASKDPLTADHFLTIINDLPVTCGAYWVAFSGGPDSSVLAHLFYRLKARLHNRVKVVYVDHGHNGGRERGGFCRDVAAAYQFSFTNIRISAPRAKGKSPEEWAREERYRLLAGEMAARDILFTGHHQDDQAETFFLQALRGAGPRGLAGMPLWKAFGKGLHARPLLRYPRRALRDYAKKNGLTWRDDDSNADRRYDRNYLRHEILPLLEQRWPACATTLARAMGHQQEYRSLLDEFAGDDLKRALQGGTEALKVDVLRTLSEARQKNLIFYWLNRLRLSPPSARHMRNILSQLIDADGGKSPCINWPGAELRRYKNLLYACRPLAAHDTRVTHHWDPRRPVVILGETLRASLNRGRGLARSRLADDGLQIRFRRGGEKISPAGTGHARPVKALFREKGILPWHRDRVPLIYVDNKLALIPGLCVDKHFSAKDDEAAWDISWSGLARVMAPR